MIMKALELKSLYHIENSITIGFLYVPVTCHFRIAFTFTNLPHLPDMINLLLFTEASAEDGPDSVWFMGQVIRRWPDVCNLFRHSATWRCIYVQCEASTATSAKWGILWRDLWRSVLWWSMDKPMNLLDKMIHWDIIFTLTRYFSCFVVQSCFTFLRASRMSIILPQTLY